MTTAGWLIMSASLVTVWSVAIWCYARLLRTPKQDVPHVSIHDNV